MFLHILQRAEVKQVRLSRTMILSCVYLKAIVRYLVGILQKSYLFFSYSESLLMRCLHQTGKAELQID